jgi:hypothetical protein
MVIEKDLPHSVIYLFLGSFALAKGRFKAMDGGLPAQTIDRKSVRRHGGLPT